LTLLYPLGLSCGTLNLTSAGGRVSNRYHQSVASCAPSLAITRTYQPIQRSDWTCTALDSTLKVAISVPSAAI
jgi:hypothetical protein